jgi:hypothetical protein
MYGMFNLPEPTPPRIGTHWRRKGEVLTWEVREVREKEVVLQGPSGRKGTQTILLLDFYYGWERG